MVKEHTGIVRHHIDQIFNKILEGNFPKIRKDTPIQIEETYKISKVIEQ